MNDSADSAAERQDTGQAVSAYKRLLKTYLDRRPSGTRQRIAAALGTHKSFVSQITNPNYRVPLPAQHVATIIRLCHFSLEEKRAFLEAYRSAHPSQAVFPEEVPSADARIMEIEVPGFEELARQQEVVEVIEEMAKRIISLAQNKGGSS